MKKKLPAWFLLIIQYSILLILNCANIAGIILFSFRYLPFFKHYDRDFGITEKFPDTFFVLLGGAIVDHYFLLILPFIIILLIFEIFYKKENKINIRSWIIVLQIIYILFLAICVLISSIECFHFASERYRKALINNHYKYANQEKNRIPNEEDALNSDSAVAKPE